MLVLPRRAPTPAGRQPCHTQKPYPVLTVGDRRNDMIKWMLRKAIDKFERNWKYDAGYMRDIIDASPRAAWLFSRAAALGQFRRDIPIGPWCAAGITAVRYEDCGPCTQLGVAMAERGRQPYGAACTARRRSRRHAAGCRAGVEIHARHART